MKRKTQLSNLLRGSPVAAVEKYLTATVDGKPPVLSRNGESTCFLKSPVSLSDLCGKFFNRKVRQEDAKNAKRKGNCQ